MERRQKVRCASLDEVREGIDRLDGEIVRLLAERGGYVAEAGRLKGERANVVDPGRIERIVARVRALAAEQDFDPDTIERIYRAMIEAYIDFEYRVFDARD